MYDLDMNEIQLPGKISWLKFKPLPQLYEYVKERVGGRDVIVSKNKLPRDIEAEFLCDSEGSMYYKLMRDEIYALFSQYPEFYVIDWAVSARRWKVHVEDYAVNRENHSIARVELPLRTTDPYCTSKGTTLDEFTYDAELWGYGMGLKYDSSTQDYIHNTSSFMIYNAGNQEVDPRESELIITLTSSTATADGLTIRNDTTNEEWQYNGVLNAGDQIILDGIKANKNVVNIVSDTELDVISLAPGENQIQITGITGAFEISFEFRFLYA